LANSFSIACSSPKLIKVTCCCLLIGALIASLSVAATAAEVLP